MNYTPETRFLKQYPRHFFVGWVERSETQRICWVSCLNPTYETALVDIPWEGNHQIFEL